MNFFLWFSLKVPHYVFEYIYFHIFTWELDFGFLFVLQKNKKGIILHLLDIACLCLIGIYFEIA